MNTLEEQAIRSPRERLEVRLEKESPNQVLLVYAGPGSGAVQDQLGVSEYSYRFVLREFLPALERLGEVIPVDVPECEVDEMYSLCVERGISCLLLSFTPPHKTPVGLACPVIPVFAWEFEDIPSDTEGGGSESDWTRPLGRLGWAITHSRFAADAVRRAMRPDFPIEVIPAPLWDRFERLRSEPGRRERGAADVMRIRGPILDSRTLDLTDFAPGPLGEPRADLPRPTPEPYAEIRGDEVVYTCIYNPYDDRKNWYDIVGIFCQEMRDAEDATLILKLVHADPWQGCHAVLQELYKCSPFRCRILLQLGYLDGDEYDQLIRVTDFAVNASKGEGQCLPVMEFMSSGRPAIAPKHTAFADYLDESNAFLVESSIEPAAWPHDPRQVYRTFRYRINPESLARAFYGAYRVAKLEPERYRRMGNAAIRALGAHCSVDIATERLRRILTLRRVVARAYSRVDVADNLGGRVATRFRKVGRRFPSESRRDDTRLHNAIPDGVDPRICGLDDAIRSGWYQQETGELVTGFRIDAHDHVLEVGCGEGGAASFCARQGARVTFLDLEREKVETAMHLFPELTDEKHLPVVGDANALGLADEVATRIIAIDVLEHLRDPKSALREMVRVGKPGAQYLISVPDPVGEHIQKAFAPADHFRVPNHLHIFAREEFRSLVEGVGLVIEQHRFTGFYWALAMCLYWAAQPGNENRNEAPTRDQIQPPYPDAIHYWANTWAALQSLPRAADAREALNRLMPKNQTIIARKPQRP